VHQQDRTTSGTELPATFEDDALRSGDFSVSPMRFVVEVNEHLERVWNLHSSVGVDIQPLHLIRVNRILIHIGGLNGRMLAGDSHNVSVGIDVSLYHQLPRLFVDGAKVTWLYGLGWAVKKPLTNRESMAMLTRMFLGGSQLGHFAAASLIRSTYLRCAFSFVRKRNIVEDSVSTRDAGEVVGDPH
jgi:hypothetical protein